MALNLLYSLLVVATAIINAAAEPIETNDTVSSGRYLIRLCHSEEPNSNATYLQHLLPQIYTNLKAVIADARLGTKSNRGYGAFFKTDDNIQEVVKVYFRMAYGTDISMETIPNSRPPGSVLLRPNLVCINDVPETGAIYQQCIHDFPETPLVRWDDTEFIALCPLFWVQRSAPVPRLDCPRLRGNTLYPNTMQLSVNHQAMIVHELAHMYADVSGWPNEAMNIQDAVDLDAKASLANANNYALYYAAVLAGCKKWPKSIPEGRELLEFANFSIPSIQSNQSAAPTIASIDFSATTGKAEPFPIEIRQDSCMSWAQAPNASVCCDHSSGEWMESAVQRDSYNPRGPACLTQGGGMSPDRGEVFSDGSPALAAAAMTSDPTIHQEYCNEAMQLPNATVCCDMSSGQWVPAGLQRDTSITVSESAACPTTGGGVIQY